MKFKFDVITFTCSNAVFLYPNRDKKAELTFEKRCSLCGVYIKNDKVLKDCPLCGANFIEEVKLNACE